MPFIIHLCCIMSIRCMTIIKSSREAFSPYSLRWAPVSSADILPLGVHVHKKEYLQEASIPDH